MSYVIVTVWPAEMGLGIEVYGTFKTKKAAEAYVRQLETPGLHLIETCYDPGKRIAALQKP